MVVKGKTAEYYAHLKRMRKRRKRRHLLFVHLKKTKRKVVLKRIYFQLEKEKITPKEGLAILVGTQIGAGVLGLPYVAAKVGLIPATMILFGIMFLLLFTAMIVLKLSVNMDGAQMSTITERILGKAGGWTMYLSITIMSFGALLAYVAGMGNVFSQFFGINENLGALIFWIFVAFIIYRGLQTSGRVELLMYYIMLTLFIVVMGMLVSYAKLSNGFYMNFAGIASMIGIAIFALGCHTVIPDVYKAIGDYQKTKRVVVLAFLIPTLIYAFFMAVFLLAFGAKTPQIATQGLSEMYGYGGYLIGNIIPFIAITTSFIGIGLAQQSNTIEFLKMKKILAWSLTTIPPLLVYIGGIKNFADVLAFAGDTGDMMSFIILPIVIWIVWVYWKRRE